MFPLYFLISKFHILSKEFFDHLKVYNTSLFLPIHNLDCEYLDLYLIHWPASKAIYENWIEINKETWEAMEYLYQEGYVKAIGVCNFKKNQLAIL